MIKYKEVSLEEVIINPLEPLGFDTETIGLYGKIRLAQFYQEGWDEVLLVNNPDIIMLTIKLNEAYPIMQHAHYDITTIQQNTETKWIPKDYECTFLLSRLKFYNKEKFSLDAVMNYVLDFDPYKKAGLNKKELQDSKWDVLVLTDDQKLYASIDVFYLLDVFNAVKGHITDTSYALDKLTLTYCLDFQWNGMPVIDEELQKKYAENLKVIEEEALPINANSWKQVRPYIGSDNSDGLGLATLEIGGNEKAAKVSKVRKLLKQNSFMNKFDVALGRIFGKFMPSARSGRLTSKDQNLQQIPRKLKHLFGFKENSNKILIYADYKQLEMRSICCIVGEAILAKLFRDGGDIHNFTAEMLFGIGFTKDQRQVSKTANFGLLYGCGWKVFIEMLIKDAMLLLSETESKTIKNKWRSLWIAIARWQDEGITAWRRGEIWATPFGRRYTAKMMTDQLNIKNQGFGAEIAKLAMHYMLPKIRALPYADEILLINFAHDSYTFECPNKEEKYKEVSTIVAEAMQKAWFEALKTGIDLKIRDLPMPVEVLVGYNWGRIEKEFVYKYEIEGMKHYVSI